MPRYAGGKYALGISDRSGRAYPLTSMIKEWNGLLVGRDEFEAKQPQLDPRHHITDPQALRISRPIELNRPQRYFLLLIHLSLGVVDQPLSLLLNLGMEEVLEIQCALEKYNLLMDSPRVP